MLSARRGEVWQVDLGMAAKARPAVIFSVPFCDDERALYAIVPHTTALRGGRFEVVSDVPWLERGAFDVQGLRNIPGSVLLRRFGTLNQSLNHPLPRQDLHLQACERLKAAHRKSLLGRPQVLSAAGVNRGVQEALPT